MTDPHLDARREEIRAWCRATVPTDWRTTQTGASEAEYVAFQRWWAEELRKAGYLAPHWPAEWGGGMSVQEQAVLFQELAAADAPRARLGFVSLHHAAATLLVAGTPEQQQRHLPAILEGEIWCQGFSEPEAGSDLASLKTRAERDGEHYVVTGQKLWATGAAEADWCLLLARTDPNASKQQGISFLLVDMTSEGIEIRPIRNANGESEFCEIFFDTVRVPVANRVGAENDGWAVAQRTLGAERGMTMLELAERLSNAFRWLVDDCRSTYLQGAAVDGTVHHMSAVADRLVELEIELEALRRMSRGLVARIESETSGPVDPAILKLYYSELLQRLNDFAVEIIGSPAQRMDRKPLSSGWESGAWVLDFIGSWEWTIPGGASEIMRSIIGERGLGLPREPKASR
jgi:alkylation response protein AidB-like acyl-CoA dehydrogenase